MRRDESLFCASETPVHVNYTSSCRIWERKVKPSVLMNLKWPKVGPGPLGPFLRFVSLNIALTLLHFPTAIDDVLKSSTAANECNRESWMWRILRYHGKLYNHMDKAPFTLYWRMWSWKMVIILSTSDEGTAMPSGIIFLFKKSRSRR